MSHAIDIQGLNEKMFLLRHIVDGSKGYSVDECLQLEVGSSDEIFEYGGFQEYFWELKSLVGNYLIESAVKIRMIQEYVLSCYGKNWFNEIEQEYIDHHGTAVLGIVEQGEFTLNLRESCNKIIHSTSAEIKLLDEAVDGETYKVWDGKYVMHGKHQGKDWVVALHVKEWGKEIESYLEFLVENEKLSELGHNRG